MIVDTSAIMAVALDEPEADAILRKMAEADALLLSVGSWIELEAVLTRRGGVLTRTAAQRVFDSMQIILVVVTIDQAVAARAAYRKYGRGTQHKAALNFGDCFAYALARETGEPLLFKGNDFPYTDVVPAL